MHRKVIKAPQMLTAKYSCVKHISEETSVWVGIWVILNHLACFWGWAVIAWEPIPIACGELGWLWKRAGAVLSHATAALKPKPAVSATCRDLWSLPLNAEGCSNPKDQSTKWKVYCALLGLIQGRVTWRGSSCSQPLRAAPREVGESLGWDNSSWCVL